MTKQTSLFILSLLLTGLFAFSPSHAATVKVEVLHSQDRYPAGGRYPLLFRLAIAGPWYLHGPKGEEGMLIPTAMRFQAGPGAAVEGLRFPRPERRKFDYAAEPVEVYAGQVLVRGMLVVRSEAPLGQQEIKGELSYQACSENSCLPPESTPIGVSLSIVPPGTQFTSLNQEVFLAQARQESREASVTGFGPGKGFWLTLAALFLAGLALNLTPCIYPLIPITVSYFGGRSGRHMGGVILHASLYVLGLATTNSALGLSAALSGELLGSALQNPLVLLCVALILIVLAASFFGLWELRLPAGLTQLASRNYGGYAGSLFMGLTLGIVAAPCIGPFLLGLLTYVGQKGDPFLGFLYFFVMSLGLGLPLALLAVFSGALRKLPLSGDWMLWVRKFMGWVLVGMAAYLVGPLFQGPAAKSGLIAVVALAAAAHLAWMDRAGSTHRGFRLFKRCVGLLLVIGAGVFLTLGGIQGEGVPWSPYDSEAVRRAAGAGRPVMLDFYADWCGPCVAMERTVFKDPEVVRLSAQFATLRVDLTTRRSSHQEALSRYQIRGVPTVVFLDREGHERKDLRIEETVDTKAFLMRMKKLLPGPTATKP
ncbi:MAG: cytochrome c biogenesis protein CcdA [Thermodesulfobacteriota bacterium]